MRMSPAETEGDNNRRGLEKDPREVQKKEIDEGGIDKDVKTEQGEEERRCPKNIRRQ